MVAEGGEALVQIYPSELDIDVLMATFDDNPEFQNGLRSATILIIPTDVRPDYDGPVFPNTTPEVIRFLKENLDDQVIVDAAILDEDYIEVAYHSETVILPVIFLAETGLLPLVVKLLGSYIHDRLKKRRVPSSEATVKSKIHHVGPNGRKFLLEYEGPAGTFERVALQKINDLNAYPNEEGPQSNNG